MKPLGSSSHQTLAASLGKGSSVEHDMSVGLYMDSLRLFLAIDLGPKTIDSLLAGTRSLQTKFPNVRWVRREALHLTLHFLGSFPRKDLHLIDRAVNFVLNGVDRFKLEISGLGVFPSVRRPSVIWAGIKHGRHPICTLANRLREKLVEQGAPSGEQEFVPHITLGRMRRGSSISREAIEKTLAEFYGHSFGRLEVRELILFSSDLRPDGVIHTVVRRWPFIS